MVAGLPGVGIGGLFYLVSAVALPLRSLWRRARGVPDSLTKSELAWHLLIAAGIVTGIWVAGWLLALALPGGVIARSASGAAAPGAWPGRSVIRVAAIAAGFITLGLVLAGVELSRLAFRWRAKRALAVAVLIALAAPEAYAAQATKAAQTRAKAPIPQAPRETPPRQPSTIERADSAYAAGDRDRARALYAEALARDPSLSRAVFRLAQLENRPLRAVELYQRYELMQPRDAWGFMAEGDVLGSLGRHDEALAAYARAATLVPDERDVAVGRVRLYERAGRPRSAVEELGRWTARHANDGEAWDLLGRASLRAGRPRAAEHAFARARAAGTVRGAAEREGYARSIAAPTVEPIVGYQRDSDGNRASRVGAFADAMIADGLRLGAGAERLTVGDDLLQSSGLSAYGRLAARASPGIRLDLQAGALRLASSTIGGADWTTPQGDLRLRLRAPLGGPSLELRAQRLALGAAPVLVANHVVRNEARATAELPAGFLRLRASARAAQLEALGEPANGRLGADGAIIAPLGQRVQLSVQYRWMGFQRESRAGYFAPRGAETIESGLYFELGGDGPVSLAADLGGGMQRVAAQGANPGPWTRSLRAWMYGSVAMGPARAVYAEVEAYDSPFAPEGAATSGTWRFFSVATGVRWGLW